MDEGRLEDIKQRKGYLLDLQENGDVDWLIEQVQELKEKNEIAYTTLTHEIAFNHELTKQNDRYREALKKTDESWDSVYKQYERDKTEHLDGMLIGLGIALGHFDRALGESE